MYFSISGCFSNDQDFKTRHAIWFLEIAFLCEVCVCVSAPAINNYSREMKPE